MYTLSMEQMANVPNLIFSREVSHYTVLILSNIYTWPLLRESDTHPGAGFRGLTLLATMAVGIF